jgi:hypothetical protein
MRQKYYHTDFVHFKKPALPGWKEYIQKSAKSYKNEQSQMIGK